MGTLAIAVAIVAYVKKYGKDFRELGNQFREFAQRIRQL